MATSDLTKWQNLKQMHPENMTALVVALAQASFMIEEILPIIPSTDDFMFEKEVSNTKFDRAKKRGEKGEAQNNMFNVEKQAASSWEYFEKYDITAKTLRRGNKYQFINVMVKGMDTIANKIRLATEMDGLEEMLGADGINTITATSEFSDYSASDPYMDIVNAKLKVELDEMVVANAIIMGAQNFSEVKLSDNVRDVAAFTYDYTSNGIAIPKIDNSRVYVASARYNDGGTLVPVLDGTVIVTTPGYVGDLREAQPYEADSEYTKKNKVLSLYASRVIRPIVTRPEANNGDNINDGN